MGRNNKKVLVVDDDAELCDLLRDFLGERGFVVETSNNGVDGLARAHQGGFDCIVLDVMLPQLDGFEVLRNIRESSQVPVVMLTAYGEDVDRIVGLEMGADDYLAKPFNPRELCARLQAVLRRTQSDATTKELLLQVEDLLVDCSKRRVECRGIVIPLTKIEYNLLVLLLRSVNQLLSKQELSEKALGKILGPHDRSLDVHISKLRAKLGANDHGGVRIKTVRGQGYLYETESDSGK